MLTTDTSFPQLTDKQTTDEKFSVITNYLYMLLEQLRYSMANLGRENFNDAEFNSIANIITEPVYLQLKDVDGNLASLTITAEQLISRMTDAEGNISVLQQTADSLTSRVSDTEGNVSVLQQTAQALSTQISNAEGDISRLTQTVNGFTLSVSNGETSSVIRLLSGSAEISSQTIQMNGLVTFTGLANGTTTINGSCIKTGLIDAAYLNLTGAITFSDLSTSVQNDIDDALNTAQTAQSTVDRWVYPGTTYIDGTRIMTGTVSASTLEGGEINLLNASGQTAGIIELTGASSYGGQKVVLRSGAIELNSQAGDVYIRSGSYGTYIQLRDDVFIGQGDLAPHSSGAQSCGTSARRWSAVYADSSEITTSDRNRKNNISYDLSAYDVLFQALKPCSFRYNNGESGRTHLGLISQDVEEAMEAAGLTSLDFAGFVKSPDKEAEGGYVYSLRYEEFISLCILEIQRLDQRVRELEEKAYG